MLHLIVFLYEALFFQQITKEGFRRGLRLFLFVAGAILVLGFAYIYLKGGNIFSFLDGYENRPFTLAQRLLTEPRILIFYVSLLLYPVPNRLSITHSIHVSTSLFDPIWTLFSILLVLGAIGYSVYLAKRQSLFSFCILFFFLNHVIESTIFPLELVFEHRNYIPSMFFFLPIAIGFAYLLKLYEKKRAMKSIISVFIVFLLIGLGNSSFVRNFAWKNEKTLWAEALEKSPNMFRPHHNLAKYYQDHGFPQKAIEEYEKALKSQVIVRKDEMAVTYYNLGKLYSDMNALNKAIYFYHSALKINPLFFRALGSLASAYDRKGSASQANYYLQKAIQLNPYDPLANFNLGLYYLKKRVPEKGIYCFNLAASNETLSKDCLFYLGIAYKQKNENGRAATYFKKAINNHVKLVDSHLNLAEIYAKTSRPELALEETRKALDLMSKSQEIFHSSMGRIFSNKKFEALQPSKTILLPLLSRSIKTKNQELRIMKEYLLGKAVDHTTDNERELEFSVDDK
jgi:Tfp pilus assembly protein PilF